MRGHLASLIAVLVFSFSPLATAGVVVDLVPDNPGPYFGGESLTVEVYLNNPEPTSFLLERIRFDFTDTDPAITLGSEFAFDYSAIGGSLNAYRVDTTLPLPWTWMSLSCVCMDFFIVLPEAGSIRIGSFGLELPSLAGTYAADLANLDANSASTGALLWAWPEPYYQRDMEFWWAGSGGIAGGVHGFTVVPGPSVLCLLGIGTALVSRRRRESKRRSAVVGCPGIRALRLGAVLTVSPVAFAQPTEIPTETIVVNVDSGVVSASGSGGTPVVVFSQNVDNAGSHWIHLFKPPSSSVPTCSRQ